MDISTFNLDIIMGLHDKDLASVVEATIERRSILCRELKPGFAVKSSERLAAYLGPDVSRNGVVISRAMYKPLNRAVYKVRFRGRLSPVKAFDFDLINPLAE